MQFWRQQEKKTHGQIDWLIDCYYNSRQLGLLPITTTCYYNLRSLGYYNSRQLLLQFTTGITIYDIITIHDKTVVTRDDLQRRFLAQHSVAISEQCCVHSKQCLNNIATLCCAKNRRWESSRVTSPLPLFISQRPCASRSGKGFG